MDTTKENTVPNPMESANILSRLFFTYTVPMFKKGYTKVLDVGDLHRPISCDKSKELGDRAEKTWDEVMVKYKEKNIKPDLKRVILSCFWRQILELAVMIQLIIVIRIVEPIMLGNLLEYFKTTNPTVTKNEAFGYAAAVAILDLLLAIITNQVMMKGFHYGMRIRIFCCALVYRKGLKLNKSVFGDSESAQITNLLSNDVSRFDLVFTLMHYIWAGPILAIIVTVILYYQAGLAGIVGTILIVLITIYHCYTTKLTADYRKKTAEKTDERIRLIEEVVSGIQVIKMYAWEIPFAKVIQWARKQEIKYMTKSLYIRGVYVALKLFTSRAALFCTVVTMTLTNEEIVTSKVFVIAALFNSVSYVFSQFFVRSLTEAAETIVSLERLNQFLISKEVLQIQDDKAIQNCNQDAIAFNNFTAYWNQNTTPILQRIDFKTPRNKLQCIIGPVGAGKSSLLQAILGELSPSGGNVQINGTISYSSQEPWLFPGTVRQNILFGSPYIKQRYDEVVKVCALESDFQQFPNGDITYLGDNGASLSGGQKARVNLARAVYKDADIYILDDPLSALDVHVAKHIYNECINGFLKEKTRVLVTHQIYLLEDAPDIIILNEGKINFKGVYDEIQSSANAFVRAMINNRTDDEKQGGDEDDDLNNRKLLWSSSIQSASDCGDVEALSESNMERSGSILKKTFSMRKKITSSTIELVDDNEEVMEKEDIKVEEIEEKVQGSLFCRYHNSGGSTFFCLLVFFLYFMTQLFTSGVDYYLSFWTNFEEQRNSNFSITEYPHSIRHWPRSHFVYIYAGLTFSLFALAMVRSLLYCKLAMLASQRIMDNLLTKILYTTMRFFDTNPSGRIMNRFSKDMGSVDELLPRAVLDAVQIIFQLFGSVALIVFINPYMLIAVAIMGVIFYFTRKIFLKSSKNIKRLEGKMKAPVFTYINSTLQGLTTIRAYKAQAILKEEFDKLQDFHTSAWFMYVSATSAFGFINDFIAACFAGVVTCTFLFISGHILEGDVGLAITQAVSLTGLLQWGMRQSAELINQLISVERVLEYDSLPKEKEPSETIDLPENWPAAGKITFKNMSLKYDESEEFILKQLNLNITPKEKVGIVGRTGSGKSSLISALFRLANVYGDIEIDDINTKDVELNDLRSKISIIPQNPVLFSGTIRHNLDPFGQFDDADLYKALNEVELRDKVTSLDQKVSHRGENFSVGQRQLICLARALIRRNKILMLDEATANVDPLTDGVIQKTIREKFVDCTVLTVAHRLNTIIDSDKVLIMDQGSIIEFDHPHRLLRNERSKFYSMVMENESNTADELRRIARESYDRKKCVTNKDL